MSVSITMAWKHFWQMGGYWIDLNPELLQSIAFFGRAKG